MNISDTIKITDLFYKLAAKKPAYYGIFLSPESHEELLNWWNNTVRKPLLMKPFAHHMTIKFKPSDEDVANYSSMIGQNFELKVVGYAEDEKGQAVLVEPQGISSTNSNPHITISCADGVTPVYSNELLSLGSQPVDGPIITGIFDSFPRTINEK